MFIAADALSSLGARRSNRLIARLLCSVDVEVSLFSDIVFRSRNILSITLDTQAGESGNG